MTFTVIIVVRKCSRVAFTSRWYVHTFHHMQYNSFLCQENMQNNFRVTLANCVAFALMIFHFYRTITYGMLRANLQCIHEVKYNIASLQFDWI